MFQLKHGLLNEAEEGTEGSAAQPDMLDQDNIQDLINQAVEKATAGLKANNEDLIREKRQMASKLKQFDGIDVESIKAMQKRLENDEDARLIAEGKIDEVLNNRTERMRQDMASQLEAANTRTESLKAELEQARQNYQGERINNELRRAAEKAGVIPEAIDDVLARGRGVFSVDENGEILARGKDGNLILSKDGKNVLGLTEFVDSLKEQAPYYWAQSNSAGLSGSARGRSSSDVNALMQAAIARGDMKEYRRLRQEARR